MKIFGLRLDWKNERQRTWLVVAFVLLYPFVQNAALDVVGSFRSDLIRSHLAGICVVSFAPAIAAFGCLPLARRRPVLIAALILTYVSILYFPVFPFHASESMFGSK